MKRVAVVGAGIIGAAIAYRLARRGAAVTLIDRAGPGAGASGKSFAWLNADDPEPAFYNRFRQEALRAWTRLSGEIDLPMMSGGCISWERGDNALRDQAAALTALGCDARLVGRDQIAARAPAVANPPDLALWRPAEGAVDAAEAARRLGDAAAAAGAARLLGADVTGLMIEGGRVAGLSTTFGPVSADLTILAAGLGARALAAEAGVDLPVAAKTGLLVRTLPVPRLIEQVILTPEIHVRQEPDGRLVAGEEFSGRGAHAGMIERDPQALAEAVLAKMRALLPGVDLKAGEVVLGVRPAPADGLPVIGPAAEGLYVSVMHSGVTLAALVGELVAAEAMGEAAEALSPFRLSRFQTTDSSTDPSPPTS